MVDLQSFWLDELKRMLFENQERYNRLISLLVDFPERTWNARRYFKECLSIWLDL